MPTAVVSISVDPLTPFVNELVFFEGGVSGDVSLEDILEWAWEFGDGQTARGREVWHQYRYHHEDEAGAVLPWIVKMTATDKAGRRYVGVKNVILHDKDLSCLSGYYMRHATAGCASVEANRPEPEGEELPYQLDDVVVGWWDATGLESFYVLAKLFYVQDADEARCTWRVFSHGESKDAAPQLLETYDSDVRDVTHNASFFYSVGFPLHVEPSVMFPDPGWYQVMAEIESSDGQHREFIDFTIYVGN